MHAQYVGEDTYCPPVTAASAGTPLVWTAWLWPATPSRLPRHGGGTPGVMSSHASSRLGLGRRWLWVGRCWLPWAGGLGPTWRPQEAAAEEIEVCPAKHLAFQHFEAVNVPLDWARTPRQGHPSFDCLVVLIQSCGEASQSLDRTGGGAREPQIELRRLPLADQGARSPAPGRSPRRPRQTARGAE